MGMSFLVLIPLVLVAALGLVSLFIWLGKKR